MKDDINNFFMEVFFTKSDRATMSASVESRAPFLDKRIAKACMAITRKFIN